MAGARPRGTKSAPAGLRLQSAACQLAYWEAGELRIVNFLVRRTFRANPVALELLRYFQAPRHIAQALSAFKGYRSESVARAILGLIEAQLLLEHGSPPWEEDRRTASTWKAWLPEGAFHFLTKDAPYIGGDWTPAQRARLVPTTPSPPLFKTIAGARRLALPVRAIGPDAYFDTLFARRTHRRFARGGVSLEDIATLLQSTWGVQGTLESPVFGRLARKTSPSGGARHPVEVYLMALRVDGLAPGMYHYQARDHVLEALPAKVSPARARRYCADQPHAGAAAALFLMTAAFPRSMWKYVRGRAYRVVLLDAGHLGQSFCLTATRMGLAPFTTAAFEDTLVERDLGIDGIAESALYIAGVGQPAGRRARPSR